MIKDVKYNIKNNVLTIEECPDNTVKAEDIVSLRLSKEIEKVIVSEGIETIGAMAFTNCTNIKEIVLPNSLKKISRSAFISCKSLKRINIPENVETIGESAFQFCENLRSIRIPEKIGSIKRQTFEGCKNLRRVNIGEGVTVIGPQAFSGCHKLKKVNIPKGVKSLINVFYDCTSLKKIEIPEGVELLDDTFNNCKNLKKVILPTSVKEIGYRTFSGCTNLNKIKLPPNLEKIGDYAFYHSGINYIEIPSTVKEIGDYAFRGCIHLFGVKFNEGLKKIGRSSFSNLPYLYSIELPDTVTEISGESFSACLGLKKIKLSKNIKSLPGLSFASCFNLNKIEIPEGISKVSIGAFDCCKRLEEIHFPQSLEYLYADHAVLLQSLKRIFLNCKDGIKEINFEKKCFVDNHACKLFFHNEDANTYGFYTDGNYIEFNGDLFENIPKIKKMIKDCYIDSSYYIHLYIWSKQKLMPSYAVIKTLPLKDIDKFFINKNCNEWAKLVRESKITYVDNVASFFKLCYVLGVFSESTNDRDKAVAFIRENILNKMTGMDIHMKFDGFDISNGFNREYAEFFIKYYNTKDFMIDNDEDEWGDEEEIDLMAASYNNFKNVKRVYPNRTIHTNREADLLLPEHVMNAVRLVEYYNINEGNDEFAILVGRYGYTQEQFEQLQRWYDEGKKIKENEMKLHISRDDNIKGITYKLLKKNDPIGAVLGDITNCCQVIMGAGSSCVEYGMTKPNSGFITFNYKDKIIGQAWVWYDEESKTICLDNIEVPHRYLEKINKNKEIQESFVKCLLRVEKNFKEEMKKHNIEVEHVTIGEGYTDITNILEKRFSKKEEPKLLSKYNGYTDATEQYVIKRKINR